MIATMENNEANVHQNIIFMKMPTLQNNQAILHWSTNHQHWHFMLGSKSILRQSRTRLLMALYCILQSGWKLPQQDLTKMRQRLLQKRSYIWYQKPDSQAYGMFPIPTIQLPFTYHVESPSNEDEEEEDEEEEHEEEANAKEHYWSDEDSVESFEEYPINEYPDTEDQPEGFESIILFSGKMLSYQGYSDPHHMVMYHTCLGFNRRSIIITGDLSITHSELANAISPIQVERDQSEPFYFDGRDYPKIWVRTSVSRAKKLLPWKRAFGRI
jgi:hypothetical protein